jgi:type I restriction enzyme S subunit
MELRPGYKATDAGSLPQDWMAIDFVSVGQVIDGDRGVHYPTAGELHDSGYCLFLNAGNVTKSGFRFDNCQFITAGKDKKLNKGRLVRGDIVLTTRGTIGNFAHYDSSVPFTNVRINSGMVILRITSSGVDHTYTYLILQSHAIEAQLGRLSFGSAQPQLTVRGLSTLKIPLPPTRAEQEAIAQVLSDAGALVASLERLLVKKRDIKQGAMQELLTGKKRFRGFNGKWVKKRLGDTAQLKARIGWQGLTTAEYLDSGDYRLVTGTDFKNGIIDWDNCHYVAKSRYEQDKYIQLKPRDVLVTKDGSIGKVALVSTLPMPATLNSGVFVIRPLNQAFHPEFFYYLLCSPVFSNFLTQLSAGSTINHLYQKDFVGFEFDTPPTNDEQNEIALALSDMDAEIAALEAKLAKVRLLKQGMEQQLLTGRMRLI